MCATEVHATGKINDDMALRKQLCAEVDESGDSDDWRELARELRLLSGRILKHSAALNQRIAQRVAASRERRNYLAAELEARQSTPGHALLLPLATFSDAGSASSLASRTPDHGK
jgi:hypothetical protein